MLSKTIKSLVARTQARQFSTEVAHGRSITKLQSKPLIRQSEFAKFGSFSVS